MPKKYVHLRPLENRVVVLPDQEQTVLPSGLILPDHVKAKTMPWRGVVLATGIGRLKGDGSRVPPDVSFGDTVIFNAFAGAEVESDGLRVKVIRDSDVLAVVPDPEAGK